MPAIDVENLPVAIKSDDAEVRVAEVGEMSVLLVRLKQGADFGPALTGLPDDLCQCPHWGYMLKGRVRVRLKSGEETYEAGQPFFTPPGHAPVAIEDSEYVEFAPTLELAKVIQHITGGA